MPHWTRVQSKRLMLVATWTGASISMSIEAQERKGSEPHGHVPVGSLGKHLDLGVIS